jgi:hypothetical protein
MNGPSDKVPELTTQEFEVLKMRVLQKFGKFLFNNTTFTIDEAWDQIVLQMESYIVGQHNLQRYAVYVEIPKNCWENFKKKHMPGWYLKRFPVKTDSVSRVITFDHKFLFPECNLVFPPDLGKVRFHSHTDDPGVIQK